MAIINKFPAGGSGLILPNGYSNAIIPILAYTNSSTGLPSSRIAYESLYFMRIFSSQYWGFQTNDYSDWSSKYFSTRCNFSFFTLKPIEAILWIKGSSGTSASTGSFKSSSFTFFPGNIYKVAISRAIISSGVSNYYGKAMMTIFENGNTVLRLSSNARHSIKNTESLLYDFYLNAIIDFYPE